MLQPRVSSHGKAYVYALENLTTGLLFGAIHDDFDFQLDVNAEGKPELYECYPGAFSAVYTGKSCTVYEVNEDGFLRGITSWSPELVSPQPVPVVRETFVPDLAARLEQAEEAGHLIVHRYADTPDYRKRISGHIVDRLIRFDMLDQIHEDPRLTLHFGALAEGLRRVMDGHLLECHGAENTQK